jgi:hypothetical protein
MMTVADLIAELQKLPADKPILIEDADTCWDMPIHVREDDNAVRLFGEYSEAVRVGAP